MTGVIPIEQADKEYKKFSDQIKKDYESDTVIKNPYYHIAIANDLVINDSSLNDKYDLAMSHFDKAIKLDEQFSAAAYAGKAWLLLKGKEKFLTANDKSTNYKQQAIIEFGKALGFWMMKWPHLMLCKLFYSNSIHTFKVIYPSS